LLLERGAQVQLVYKHAISTLQPAQPLNLGDSDPDAASE
jgi:host factor-I protein